MIIKPHDSIRGHFAYELYKHMQDNKDIILVTGDLGYAMFDQIRKDFPNQFINTGAAEQVASDICVGLALQGKIPFMYTITPFYYRCFETIRTYINHEKLNVKLIGSGVNDDYKHDGFSHNASDIGPLFKEQEIWDGLFDPFFDNITSYWPDDKLEIEGIVNKMVKSTKPAFLSLRR